MAREKHEMIINLQNIETVLLDMDGTLLDLHFDNYFWQTYLYEVYSVKHQLTLEESRTLLEPEFTSRRGTLDWYCVEFWSNKLGLDIMQLKGEVAQKIGFRPQAKQFLAECQRKVPDVRLITNGHRRVLELKIQRTQLDQYFNQLICSHELGSPKEDQQFWHALQKVKRFDPDQTLFVDDSEAVLDSARDYGIKHVYSIKQPDSQIEYTRSSKYPMV